MVEFALYDIEHEVKEYLQEHLNRRLTGAGLSAIDNFRVGIPKEDDKGELRTCGIYVNADEGVDMVVSDDETLRATARMVIQFLLSDADDNPVDGGDSLVGRYADIASRVLGEHKFQSDSMVYKILPGHAYEFVRPDVTILMEIVSMYSYYED